MTAILSMWCKLFNSQIFAITFYYNHSRRRGFEIIAFKDMKNYPVLPSAGYIQLRVFNGEPQCDYVMHTNLPMSKSKFNVQRLEMFENKFISVRDGSINMRYSFESADVDCPKFAAGSTTFYESNAYSLFLQSEQPSLPLTWYRDDVEKPTRGLPLVRNLANVPAERKIIWRQLKTGKIDSTKSATDTKLIELSATEYEVLIDDVKVHQDKLRNGGVYALLLSMHNVTITKMIEVTEPNTMSMLWLIPQYMVITLGEVMFSVTGLEFSYSESPVSMKSVLQACWLLTVAFGNVIVVIIAELKIFKSQASEFFLFAGIMFADTLLFMWVAYCYKPNNPNSGVRPVKAAAGKDVAVPPRPVSNSGFRPKYMRKLEED